MRFLTVLVEHPVAREVRISPLLNLDGAPSPHLEPVRASLFRAGFDVSVDAVPYEFQWGSNLMMRILGVQAIHSIAPLFFSREKKEESIEVAHLFARSPNRLFTPFTA